MTRQILFEIVPRVKEAARGFEPGKASLAADGRVEALAKLYARTQSQKTRSRIAGLLDSDSYLVAGLAVQGDAHQNVLAGRQIARKQNRHLNDPRNSWNGSDELNRHRVDV